MTTSTLAYYLAIALGVMGFCVSRRGTLASYFRLPRVPRDAVVTAAFAEVFYLGSIILLGGIYAVVGKHLTVRPRSTDFGHIVTLLVFSSTIGPWLEELFFRGLVLEVFRRVGRLELGIVISCLLFGLAHDNFVVVKILLGASYCFLRFQTGGLLVPMLFHSGANLIVPALASGIEGLFPGIITGNHHPAAGVILLALLVGTGLVVTGLSSLATIVRYCLSLSATQERELVLSEISPGH